MAAQNTSTSLSSYDQMRDVIALLRPLLQQALAGRAEGWREGSQVLRTG